MNSRYLMLGLIATACGGNAMAAGFGYMSNDVAAYNIVAAQHTIQARASLIPIRAYAPTRTNAPVSDSDFTTCWAQWWRHDKRLCWDDVATHGRRC